MFIVAVCPVASVTSDVAELFVSACRQAGSIRHAKFPLSNSSGRLSSLTQVAPSPGVAGSASSVLPDLTPASCRVMTSGLGQASCPGTGGRHTRLIGRFKVDARAALPRPRGQATRS
ncbi:unnamed protein product [Protopolystoma xenopodis]|uniref:Uncharacterized protein n=1 Tax=Protopolystoma xenopodis TaxID=117903 RepID=A0A3S5AHZ1_9PLAT|nr:unnamed protein product [Protopolystoma xenopodis]